MDIGKVVTSSSIGAGVTALGERWVNAHPEGYHKGLYSETIQPFGECYFYDDFWTKLEVATFWTLEDTGAATELWSGTPGPGGWAELTLSGGAVETAGIDCGDVLCFSMDYGLQFETKAMPLVLPTATGELWIGVANANVETTIVGAGPTIHAFFVMDGSGIVTIFTDDGAVAGAHNNEAVATGVTLTAGVGACFRIDFTDVTNVKFYINGKRVAAGTTFNMNSAVVGRLVQPMLQAINFAASVGTLSADYVRIWQERY